MVEQLPTHTSGPAARRWRSAGDFEKRCGPAPCRSVHGRDNVRRELRVSVEDQEPMRVVASPCITQLQYNPQGVRRTGHVAVQNLAPVMGDDKETVPEAGIKARRSTQLLHNFRVVRISKVTLTRIRSRTLIVISCADETLSSRLPCSMACHCECFARNSVTCALSPAVGLSRRTRRSQPTTRSLVSSSQYAGWHGDQRSG
jgi:hypothetical protein